MLHGLVERQGKTKFLTARGQEFLIGNEPNPKYKFMWALMADAGIRVTEMRMLRWKDFDFGKRQLTVQTLKQRATARDKKPRTVPMTERVFEHAGAYWKSIQHRPESGDLLFPSPYNGNRPISRQQIDRNLKDIIPGISAHTLRHTFGAKLASEGTSVETTARLLGHRNTDITFNFYYHLPEQILRRAVQRTEHRDWLRDTYRYFFPARRVHIQPMTEGLTNFHVGRKKELLELSELSEKKVNVLLTGAQGMGKSHLLQNLGIEKTLWADEVNSPKRFVGGMLLKLYKGHEDENGKWVEGKDAAIELVTKNADLKKYVVAETVANIVEVLIQVTAHREYTLIIDDVTRLTPAGLNVLEKLKTHFHIIAAARQVKVDKLSGFTNFQRIELKPLGRTEAHEFADIAGRRLAARVEDWGHFREYLYRQTKGNPGFMLELLDRLDVETDLSVERVTAIEHIAARRGVAIFPFVVVLFACTTALRYLGRGVGVERDLVLILSGIGMLALLFGRQLIRRARRQNL